MALVVGLRVYVAWPLLCPVFKGVASLPMPREKMVLVKTRLPAKLYERVRAYAERYGVSVYVALRQLIIKGLDHEGGLYRLLGDDEFLLSLVTVKVKVDPAFAKRVARVLSEVFGEEL